MKLRHPLLIKAAGFAGTTLASCWMRTLHSGNSAKFPNLRCLGWGLLGVVGAQVSPVIGSVASPTGGFSARLAAKFL